MTIHILFGCLTVTQTDKAVYLVMTNNKDGKPVTHLDRKINLESIEGISMTNLRDDWMVCYLLILYFRSITRKLGYSWASI